MELKNWYFMFTEQLVQTGLIEWLAVGFGVTQVLLAKRNNILLYPMGIIAILLSMYMMFNARLYADTLLSMYYLVMSVYGWLAWDKRGTLKIVDISWCSNKELKIAILISTGGFLLLYMFLKYFTDSDVPVWDAFISATAWAGMWLLAKRKIENWIFLNISNFFAVPLLIQKKLPMFAVLTTVLFIVAIFGFLEWKRKLGKASLTLETNLSHEQ